MWHGPDRKGGDTIWYPTLWHLHDDAGGFPISTLSPSLAPTLHVGSAYHPKVIYNRWLTDAKQWERDRGKMKVGRVFSGHNHRTKGTRRDNGSLTGHGQVVTKVAGTDRAHVKIS